MNVEINQIVKVNISGITEEWAWSEAKVIKIDEPNNSVLVSTFVGNYWFDLEEDSASIKF